MQQLRPRKRPGLAVAVSVLAAVSALGASEALAASAIVVAQAKKPTGQGVINSIDATNRKLNITHGPIPALNWPGMTMNFGVAPGVDLTALKAREKISFTLGRGADGVYVIESLIPAR